MEVIGSILLGLAVIVIFAFIYKWTTLYKRNKDLYEWYCKKYSINMQETNDVQNLIGSTHE